MEYVTKENKQKLLLDKAGNTQPKGRGKQNNNQKNLFYSSFFSFIFALKRSKFLPGLINWWDCLICLCVCFYQLVYPCEHTRGCGRTGRVKGLGVRRRKSAVNISSTKSDINNKSQQLIERHHFGIFIFFFLFWRWTLLLLSQREKSLALIYLSYVRPRGVRLNLSSTFFSVRLLFFCFSVVSLSSAFVSVLSLFFFLCSGVPTVSELIEIVWSCPEPRKSRAQCL